jgi:Arabinose efflux permease
MGEKNNLSYNRSVQIILFFILSVLFFISIAAFDPFITPYATQLNIPVAQIGVILSVAGFSSLLARFPIGIIAEMFRKKKVLIQAGLLLTFVAWLIAFFFPSSHSLLIGKTVDGLTGATWVMYTVLFSTHFKNEEIPKAIGTIQLASTLGPFIGMNIGGLVSKVWGYEYSFIVAVIASGLGLIISLFIVEPHTTPATTAKEAFSLGVEQIRDKDVWILGLFASVAMMTTYAGRDLLTPIVAGKLGGDAIAITILPNLFMIFNSIAAVLSGTFFPKRLGLIRTVAIGALGQGFVAIAMPYSTSLIMLYVLQCFGGFFFSMNITVLLSLILIGVRAEVQTSRMGLYQSIYSVGLMIGPMISGFILENTNLKISYLIIGCAVIIMALLSKRLLPEHLLTQKAD